MNNAGEIEIKATKLSISGANGGPIEINLGGTGGSLSMEGASVEPSPNGGPFWGGYPNINSAQNSPMVSGSKLILG